MLDGNVNKVTWVGVAIGIIAALGIGSMALFPDALDSGRGYVVKMVKNFSGTPQSDNNKKPSNLNYEYDATSKTAAVVGVVDGDKSTASKPMDLVIPSETTKDGVTYKVTSVRSGSGQSMDSVYIQSVSFPDTVKTIGDSAFAGSHMSGHITIPDTVTTIGDNAFQGAGLRGVSLGSGVTSIGMSAFSDNDLSDDLVIPDNVTTVGFRAFSTSNSSQTAPMGTLTLGKNLTNVDMSAFSVTADKVYVPDSLGSKVSPDWFMNGMINHVSLPANTHLDMSNVQPFDYDKTQSPTHRFTARFDKPVDVVNR